MGCQTEIAQTVVDSDGDYVLALTGNPGQLHEDVKLLFDGIASGQFSDVNPTLAKRLKATMVGLKPVACAISDPGVISSLRNSENFVNLSSVVKVTAQREINDRITIESRYLVALCS